MTKTLIIGANGVVGSEVAKNLASYGHELRKTTHREPTAAEEVQVNLKTGEGLEAAFEGIDRAFFMAPSGDPEQDKLLKPLIEAAQKHQLKKVVMMTAMGADAVESSPMRQAEIALENSGIAYAIVRPNWFMQNFHTFWLGGILARGVIALPTGDAKGSFIDARDIGAVIATLLNSDAPEHQNKAFNITGPESLNHDEVAAILTEVTGRQIRYEDTAPETVKQGLVQAGLSEGYSDFLLMILDAFKQGYSAAITPDVEAIIGREPITFAQYARDYRTQYQPEPVSV